MVWDSYDARARAVWNELQERQQRLPLSRIRRAWQWHALSYNEDRAASRIVNRHDLTDDDRYSLLHHHSEAVNRLAADAFPEFVPLRTPSSGPVGMFRASDNQTRRHLAPRSWACWLGNRKVGIRHLWFRLTWRY